jgi:hypothetical protein
MERLSAIANGLIFILLLAFIANSLVRMGLFLWDKYAL